MCACVRTRLRFRNVCERDRVFMPPTFHPRARLAGCNIVGVQRGRALCLGNSQRNEMWRSCEVRKRWVPAMGRVIQHEVDTNHMIEIKQYNDEWP